MKATQQFIEDAIKGGWYAGYFLKSWHETGFILEMETDDGSTITTEIVLKKEQALLDPHAWRCVGSVRGWQFAEEFFKATKFLEGLWQGKTIEDSLTEISK